MLGMTVSEPRVSIRAPSVSEGELVTPEARHQSPIPRVEAEGIASAGIGHASLVFPCFEACFRGGKFFMPPSAPIRENVGRARGSLASDARVLAKQPKRQAAVEHGPPSARDHLLRMVRPAITAGLRTGTQKRCAFGRVSALSPALPGDGS